MKCQNCVPFCKIFCRPCEYVDKEETCPNHTITCGGKNIPTFSQYREILKVKLVEKQKIFKYLDKNYVKTTIYYFDRFQKVMEFTDQDSIGLVNNKNVSTYVSRLIDTSNSDNSKQYSLPTIKSFIEALHGSFCKWIRQELCEEWVIPQFEMPDSLKGVEYPRYQEKSQELKTKVAIWYRSLYNRGLGTRKNKDRMFVMFMYKYAMRNGDVLRLRYTNFVFENGRCRLIYTPNKTSRSSKTVVKVFLSQMDQHDLLEYKRAHDHSDDDFIFDATIQHSMIARLNKELRALGFTGSKGLYELRKLCIDAILKKYGILQACAISGDNYDTIQHFYSDPRSIDFTGLNDDEYLRSAS